ncbi:Peptidyl-prolyl cis-trans isomerase-like 4 [Fulvia fulva]|uniref:Peptidyl-prolyl cis-trans isomerase n=1 Tax=Passalora fulva TaxID=5499 RepID=A0A9Q8LG37_PASFU|nr:Peptidyl-prolyl cis-trans isomerase-like 4 [Fulvia fulva]KAK4626461.1 Peptidyl-prolyl cis-trans isomerase-like 4 [Fulvia fulva]KAK4627389.1 Peptidyl-prolyl cis-trans isomerase-like 4 [Fulvia fulva]UJO16850.1 Peptidyl-prolyl cis-trans isomerase-like 4 [Fulvia fulva]WPV13844.1 Peptidyl-prolyl cis-trans isomerase-like 4 [Fulvia fulva]WPV29302.1 Peptidyl-prolyl cis-trans isomerase-like 4 [Fulvia fulva]
MSVLLETSVGDITIDLAVDDAPQCCENFLKLCKVKYYNYSPIYNVQPNFSFQTGDPIGPESKDSDAGSSIWALPDGETKRALKPERKTFAPEFSKKRKHTERGTVSMATTASKVNPDERLASSQFIITLGDNLEQLDGKAASFGEVVEGFDVLEKVNTAFIDSNGRPLKDIRILHTVVLEDPFDDPTGLVEPPGSPVPCKAQRDTVRIAHDEVLAENDDPEQMEKIRREREARAQALTLELIGDLPFADVTPPEQILFVCKLNPVTRDEDLELIFSRFGKILSCEVIRDKKTGDSLQYAFIEFANKEDCERAYFKMQGVLIDDHRIHVDFSQSVSKLSADWRTSTNSKTARSRGGFGGIDSLEKRKQYRSNDGGRDRDRGRHYDYVFDKKERRGSDTRDAPRRRSRSRSQERGDAKDSHRYRSRSRSPKRHSKYGGDRREDRQRDDRRRRSRSGDRYDSRR